MCNSTYVDVSGKENLKKGGKGDSVSVIVFMWMAVGRKINKQRKRKRRRSLYAIVFIWMSLGRKRRKK